MPADLYTDAAPAAPPTEEPSAPEAPPPEQEEKGGNVAELPKTVLGGKDFKPGEEVVLEVVEVRENSVLVKYASEEKGGGYGEPPAEESSSYQPGPMGSMME